MSYYSSWHIPGFAEHYREGGMGAIARCTLPEFPGDGSGKVIDDFFKANGVHARVVGSDRGPVVTRYILELTCDTERISRIEALRRDIGLKLGVGSSKVYIGETLWDGRVYLSLEVPNIDRVTVPSGCVLPYGGGNGLRVCFGVDTAGKPYTVDVAKAPHMLVAGQSGSGKSVFLNSLICGVVLNYHPSRARVIIVDPKGTEFNAFSGHPSVGGLAHEGRYRENVPFGTDDAVYVVETLVEIMKLRMAFFRSLQVNNVDDANKIIENSDSPIPFEHDGTRYTICATMPRLMVVIDEFYDLMVGFGDAFETPLSILAAKARSAGIHLVLATQRPSADVVRGALKANLSTRVALKVASRTDSQVIIDRGGAESLCGNGDMLYVGPDGDVPTRLHGCYVSEEDLDCVRSTGANMVHTGIVQKPETCYYF